MRLRILFLAGFLLGIASVMGIWSRLSKGEWSTDILWGVGVLVVLVLLLLFMVIKTEPDRITKQINVTVVNASLASCIAGAFLGLLVRLAYWLITSR